MKLLANVSKTYQLNSSEPLSAPDHYPEHCILEVERREDSEATIKEQETFDILIKAGYYRVCVKGLSAFDKVVGGMTWCNSTQVDAIDCFQPMNWS
uniref:CCDC93 N-terminal domain-containing protein n=1 Tax=Glossina morsitans morsitans TaxID=37546 RepID=A0A1B0FEC1_GLOMM